MFLCRIRLLSRPHAPGLLLAPLRLPATRLAFRRHERAARAISSAPDTAAGAPTASDAAAAALRTVPTPDLLQFVRRARPTDATKEWIVAWKRAHSASPSFPDTGSAPSADADQAAAETAGYYDTSPFVAAFMALRARDPAQVAELSREEIFWLVAHAKRVRGRECVQALLEDCFALQPPGSRERAIIAQRFLRTCAPLLYTEEELVSPTQFLNLLLPSIDEGNRNDPSLTVGKGGEITALAEALVASVEPRNSADPASYTALCAFAVLRLSENMPTFDALLWDDPGRRRGMDLTVQLLLRMLALGVRDARMLEVLSTLYDKGWLPALAMRNTDVKTGDFAKIVTGALIRGYQHCRLSKEAIWLFVHSFPAKATPEAGLEILPQLLEEPNEEVLTHVSWLLPALLRRPDIVEVPEIRLQRFYELAAEREMPWLMKPVYKAMHEGATRYSKPLRAPPSAAALVAFMRHLAETGEVGLGHTLAQHVVEGGVTVPVQFRAVVIGHVASIGFGREARALWERYSEGRDGRTVVGNAAMMLRVVSFFSNLAKREKVRRARRAMRLSPLTAPDGSALDDGPVHPGADQLPDEPPADNAEQLADQIADYNADLAPADADEPPTSAAAIEALAQQDSPEGMLAFARRVMEAFRKSKHPLSEAAHQDLNALARAYIILGETKAAFNTLRLVLERREIPDMHDVNVALSALAAQSPREAGRLLRRMFTMGLTPDVVSIGTVLHHACAAEDVALVEWLIDVSRKTGRGELTMQAVARVVRANVDFARGDATQLRTALQDTLQTVTHIGDMQYLGTPDLGGFCAQAALDAGDAALAFAFWARLVDGRVDGDTMQARRLRERLGREIAQSVGGGWARAALDRLGVVGRRTRLGTSSKENGT